jgi:multimeric flavodoxin WrbA
LIFRKEKMSRSILVVTGSPRAGSTSNYLADEVIRKLEIAGNRVERVSVKDADIRPCIACDSCRKEGNEFCIYKDGMKPLYPKIVACDAILLTSPVYWFNVSAQIKAFVDRLYGLNIEKTKSLEGKKFGLIFSYGDTDPVGSGVINAIRSFKDMFAYTGSDLCGVIHVTELSEKKLTPELEQKVDDLAQALGGAAV